MPARRRASERHKQNGPPQGEARSCFHSKRDRTLFIVTLIVAFTVSTTARFWDAPDISHLITAADHTSHWPFDLSAPRFELNFIERHTVAARANLLSIAAIVEVDIMKAAIVRFISDRASASTDRLALGLAIIVAVAIVVSVVAIAMVAARTIADRAIAILANPEMDTAIPAVKCNAARHAFVGLAMVRKRRSSEEQRRRKG